MVLQHYVCIGDHAILLKQLLYFEKQILKAAQLKHYPEIYALDGLVEKKGSSTKSSPVPSSQDFISHHLHYLTSSERFSLGKETLDSSEALPEHYIPCCSLAIFISLAWCLPFHVWGNRQKDSLPIQLTEDVALVALTLKDSLFDKKSSWQRVTITSRIRPLNAVSHCLDGERSLHCTSPCKGLLTSYIAVIKMP